MTLNKSQPKTENIILPNYIECKISKHSKKIGISGNVIEEESLTVAGYDLDTVSKEFDKRWLKENEKNKKRR